MPGTILATPSSRPHSPHPNGTSKSHMSLNRKASLTLDFIVVGGGIAGLASAYALARVGHRVRILEQSEEREQISSSGLRVPPNMSKILREWGLGPELEDIAPLCRTSWMYCMKTGQTLGHYEWLSDVIQETGAEFYTMQFKDLYGMLKSLCTSVGVQIQFCAKVASIIPPTSSSDRVQVRLEGGEELSSDLLIGADGASSTVRRTIWPNSVGEQDGGISFYLTKIPVEQMKKDADPIVNRAPDLPDWPIWMDTGRDCHGFPVGGGEYALMLDITEPPIPDDELSEDWAVEIPTDSVPITDCEPRIKRLWDMAPTAYRMRYIKSTHAEDWVDNSARIMLTGNAAHPLLPCSMHNCALAIEDAAVIGSLFSHLHSKDQIRLLAEAFQDVRQARCAVVHASDHINTQLLWLSPGPQREARDVHLASTIPGVTISVAEGDEEKLRKQWDDVGVIFGYSAREEAENWWVKWGVLRESSKSGRMFDRLEVMKSMEVVGDVKVA